MFTINKKTQVVPTEPCSVPVSPTDPQPVVGQVEQFLKDAISQMEPEAVDPCRGGLGRPRVLPALALWAGMLVCVLRGFTSQIDIWRLLTARQLWFYPRFQLSDQAVYDRLENAGTAPLEQLFQQITDLLQHRLRPYAQAAQYELAPFATAVVALDETTGPSSVV
ncbi:MAG: hypothetical protein M1531_09555 [Chloroflexi bacterium]|nr:hypothetical protein [Chloroflexota bacterium]